jgi:DNA repair ATPase RecN
MKFFQVLTESSDEAQYRREEREWELGPNTPEEGLKAHALLDWLRDNGDVEVRTPEQTVQLQQLKLELEDLENSENPDEDEVNELENQIEELEDAIDVYDIIPSGSHYYMDEFEVPSVLSGRRYAVGTQEETTKSAYDACKSLIDDIGIKGFNPSFARSHIDEEKVEDEARSVYEHDVYENPDSYLSDGDRNLSSTQEGEISVLKKKIRQAQQTIEVLKELGNTQSKITELEEMIDDFGIEIDEIEDSPEGEFPDEKIEEKVDDLVQSAVEDPEYFLNDLGLDWEDFVDIDELIDDAIDSDGEAHFINSYDGSSDEIEVNGRRFIVMRID